MTDKGVIRNLFIGVALFTCYWTTATLLEKTHPVDERWLGWLQAIPIEGALWYAIEAVRKAGNKFIIWGVILLLAAVSGAAQIVSAGFNAPALPNEAQIPEQVVNAWRYVLPVIPVLAAIIFGLVDVASGEVEKELQEAVSGVVGKVKSAVDGNKKAPIQPENTNGNLNPVKPYDNVEESPK